MTNPVLTTGPMRQGGGGHGLRSDHPEEEDRSFGEIRRVVQNVTRIVRLHPFALFVPFVVVTSSAFVISLYAPRTYNATTSFTWRDDPVAQSLDVASGATAFRHFRSTMAEDLASLACMAEVVENLGLTQDLPRDTTGELTHASRRRRDTLARDLGSRLAVTSTSPSELIEHVQITYTGPDPTIGARLVDEAKGTYIRRAQQWLHDFLADQRAYFAAELDAARQELAEARRIETALRMQNPYLNPNDPGAINVKLTQLENERRELLLRRREHEADLLAAQQVLASLEAPSPPAMSEDDSTSPQRDMRSPEALALAIQLQEVTREIERLRVSRGMTLQHPEIIELTRKHDGLAAALEAQRGEDAREQDGVSRAPLALPDTGADAAAQARAWQIDRRTAEVRLAALQEKIREAERNLTANGELAGRLNDLKQNIFERQEEFALAQDRVSKAMADYRKMEQQLAEVDPALKLIEQNRLVHFQAASPARGSLLPVLPRALNVVLLSLLAGLIAGVVGIVLAEILDHMFRSSGHVSRSLGLPILEAIDEIVTGRDRRRLLVRRMVVAPAVLGVGLAMTALTGALAYLSLTKPNAYDRLRRLPNMAAEYFADGADSARAPIVASSE